MTQLYNNDFEAVTIGQPAPSAANVVGTWLVAANGATRRLLSNGNGNGDVCVFSGVAASGANQIDIVQTLPSGSPKAIIAPIVGSNAAGTTHYVMVVSGWTGAANTGVAMLFKKVGGGAYSQVGGNVALNVAATAGDTVYVRGRRTAAGAITFWLGVGSLPGAANATWNDTSITGNGYCGLYNALDTTSGVVVGADQVIIDDTLTATATGLTISGAATGVVGSASGPITIGVTPVGGALPGGSTTVTVAYSGAGTLSATSVVLTDAAPSASVTLTPTAVGSGNITLTNDDALTNPAAHAFSATAGVAVPVTDANWQWSPANWATVSGVRVAVNGGAHTLLPFTGTAVSVGVDVSALVAAGVAAGWYPIVRYSVDNGPLVDVQLTPSSTAIAVNGLAAGNHTIELWLQAGWWENVGGTAPDRWTTPVYALRISGAALDVGASTYAAGALADWLWVLGDSISEGIRANNATAQPGCQSAYDSVPAYIAQALGCRLGNCSFGGTNYNSGFNSIPGLLTSYQYVYAGQSRLSGGVLSPGPKYVLVAHGANGNPTQADVQSAIGAIRTVAPDAMICVQVPLSGTGRTNITAAVAAYQAAHPTDAKVALIDLGTTWQTGLTSLGNATKQAIDGLHPRATWNARIGAEIARRISALGVRPSATKTISIVMRDEAGVPIANASGFSGAFFDVAVPGQFSVAAWAGSIPAADAGGAVSLTVTTSLAAGQVGMLCVSNTSGDPAVQSHAYFLPATVA